MKKGERRNVYEVYNEIAAWFAQHRSVQLKEKKYLDYLITQLPTNGIVLDLGCGTGKPILEYFYNKNVPIVGVDASREIIKIAKANFPSVDIILRDMRLLDLGRGFDAIIAWHSFFHLPANDQPKMFQIFGEHLNPNGILIFTSGTERGEAWGMNGGKNLFHASLDSKEYEFLLNKHHFKVLKHVVNDPECNYDTIWVAQYCP